MGIVVDFNRDRASGENLNNRRRTLNFHRAEDLNNDYVKVTATEPGAFSFLEIDLAMPREDYEMLALKDGDTITYRIDTKVIDGTLYRLLADSCRNEQKVVSLMDLKKERKEKLIP